MADENWYISDNHWYIAEDRRGDRIECTLPFDDDARYGSIPRWTLKIIVEPDTPLAIRTKSATVIGQDEP